MFNFHFHAKLDQALLLGRKARRTREILDGTQTVPDFSIYYHSHRYLQQHHYLSPDRRTTLHIG